MISFHSVSHPNPYSLHYVRKNLLLKTYEGESNQECFVFAARFLLTFTASGVALFEEGEMAFTHQDYWNRLVEQFGSVHSQSVSDAVLPLLGALLTEVMKTSDAAFSAQCLDMWTHYVIQCSVPSSVNAHNVHGDMYLTLLLRNCHFVSQLWSRSGTWPTPCSLRIKTRTFKSHKTP